MKRNPIVGARYKVHRHGLPNDARLLKRIVGDCGYMLHSPYARTGFMVSLKALRRLERASFFETFQRYMRLEREYAEGSRDIEAYHAPSECYGDLYRSRDRKILILEEETGWTVEELIAEAERRTSPSCISKLLFS